MEADENFVGTPVKLDEAKRRIKDLEAGEEPLCLRLTIELDDPAEKNREALNSAMDGLSAAGYRPVYGRAHGPGSDIAFRHEDYV